MAPATSRSASFLPARMWEKNGFNGSLADCIAREARKGLLKN
jgi:hypothetical protein